MGLPTRLLSTGAVPALGPDDCTPDGVSEQPLPLTSGDLVVTDVQPLPTSKAQCKNGGWSSFPGFKNQGDCVSFVATGGRNQPEVEH